LFLCIIWIFYAQTFILQAIFIFCLWPVLH
jgi:hypothetical protein